MFQKSVPDYLHWKQLWRATSHADFVALAETFLPGRPGDRSGQIAESSAIVGWGGLRPSDAETDEPQDNGYVRGSASWSAGEDGGVCDLFQDLFASLFGPPRPPIPGGLPPSG